MPPMLQRPPEHQQQQQMVDSRPQHSLRVRRSSVPDLKTTSQASNDKKVPTGPRANPLYKTKMCINFQATGHCPYTDKCQFAHGQAELAKWEAWRAAKQHQQRKEQEPTAGGQPSLGNFRFEVGSNPDESFALRLSDLSLDGRTRSRSEHDDFDNRQMGGRIMSWPAHGNPSSTPSSTSTSSSAKQRSPIAPIYAPGENFSLWSAPTGAVESSDESPQHDNRSRSGTQDSNAESVGAPPPQSRTAPTLFPQPPVNLDFLL